jgi:hypothetical protein
VGTSAVHDINGKLLGRTSGIWRSVDEGANVTKRQDAVPYPGTQGVYDNAIWAGDPNNTDFIVVRGINLWKSTDG